MPSEKWWVFSQNNSFGQYDSPICLIVKASDYREANEKAAASGDVYFNGVDNGIDCPCCGDRWYEESDDDSGYASFGDALAYASECVEWRGVGNDMHEPIKIIG